ncbi:glycosyltransferase family 4 protein [Hyphomicrobium sp. NDB2Meth4]|uniref:glycosyltransferase family 4 protein n=1 Tax=Hyphomicrobium sp. NDB2Meth4 TaxID=1892846 RepID=UPI000930F8DE|nr:glycosyltransferase family 4 protein [Hyphomicrobium sp. NDB2Meth4]
MKILVVSQYFWPESFVINDLVRALSRAGHQVTVATGKPNYPTGSFAPGYTAKGVLHEQFGAGVDVIRVPIRPRGKGDALALCLNYLSFAASATFRLPRLLRGRDFDVILFFGVSPLTAAIPAVVVSWLKKAHLVLWIQDLWPESLSATGFVKNRLVLYAVGLMVRLIYRAADTILLQSEAFFEPVSAYADRRKLDYFPNLAPDLTEEEIPPPPDVLVHLENCFPIVFAGNLGRAQALPTVIEAARLLKDHPEIRIIVVGTGSEASTLSRGMAELELTNIKLTGLLDRAMMPAIFRRAAALMVTLNDHSSLAAVIPSKVQAYMQAGRPIIGALNGEGARIITSAGAGLVVPAEDGAGLAQSILTLYSMPASRREAIGTAGRRYFEAHFDPDHSAGRLMEIIEARMGIRK